MKSTIKKVLGLALASVLAISLTAEPAVAAVETVEAPTQVTLYTNITAGNYSTTSFTVRVPEYKKVTSLKSSKKDVAKISYLERSKDEWVYEYDYYDDNGNKTGDPYKSGYNYYYNYIGLRIYKAGTSTISYKYDGETYKTKVTAKKWVNPVKALTISNVNGNKSLASKTKNSSYVSGLKISKDTKGATIKVTAADGWKISSVQYNTQKKVQSGENSYYYSSVESHSTNPTGASSATLYIGNIKKGGFGYVYVTFYNAKDNGYESVSYIIGR